ncbi:hypothetical protein IQ268_17165 [Oculatella sp. LEGE 06141]|uniref:hypothetical protein n=1 Tax=Oculatella sp. LEGE 06141 TaxID=1828648 RepID=UPI001882E56E|nr:hypothetical protein [Oculatella sp. LEGE 06141]MBE9180294.1 hypothetical protein [Oculatella sp. LEGE 06141]
MVNANENGCKSCVNPGVSRGVAAFEYEPKTQTRLHDLTNSDRSQFFQLVILEVEASRGSEHRANHPYSRLTEPVLKLEMQSHIFRQCS